jgi:hypothetical protein
VTFFYATVYALQSNVDLWTRGACAIVFTAKLHEWMVETTFKFCSGCKASITF